MADAGRIIPIYKGNWILHEVYEVLDQVTHTGSTYTAKNNIADSATSPDLDTTNWFCSSKGFVGSALSDITATDTSGLLGAAGSTVGGQALTDEITDRIKNDLLEKTSVVNATTTTESGHPLDARQANPNENGSLAQQITQINNNLNMIRTFKNKKILILGDSISDETMTGDVSPNWVSQFKTKLSGIAGTITNNSVAGRKMIELPGVISAYSSLDYDIVIVFLGTNDWGNNVPLGNYGASYTTKYSDAIRQSFENINNKYSTPKPLIYFVTPLWRNNAASNTLGYNLNIYRKPLVGFCKRWGSRWINGEGFPFMSDYYKTQNDIYMDDVHPKSWYAGYMCEHIINKIMAGGDSDFNNEALVKNISGNLASGNSGSAHLYFNGNDMHIRCSFSRTPTNGDISCDVLTGLQELTSDVFGEILYSPAVYYIGATGTTGSGFVFSPSAGVIKFNSNIAMPNEAISFRFDLKIKPSWCNILKEL